MKKNESLEKLLKSIDGIFKDKKLTPAEIAEVIKRIFEDISVNHVIDAGEY